MFSRNAPTLRTLFYKFLKKKAYGGSDPGHPPCIRLFMLKMFLVPIPHTMFEKILSNV